MTPTKATEQILEILSNCGEFFRREVVCTPPAQTPKCQLSISLIVPCQGWIFLLGYSNPGCHIVKLEASPWLSLFQFSFLFQSWLVFSWQLPGGLRPWFIFYEELSLQWEADLQKLWDESAWTDPTGQLPCWVERVPIVWYPLGT